MKILDLQELGYKKVAKKDIKNVDILIKYQDLLGMSMKELNEYLAQYWDAFEEWFKDSGANYCITIQIEDSGVQEGEESGLSQIIGDSFAAWLLMDEPRRDENRLAIPTGLVAEISRIKFLQLVNRKTKINNMICFITINGGKKVRVL